MNNTYHASNATLEKRYHMAGPKDAFSKFMDICDTHLQVQGPLMHLTLLYFLRGI
jgi:hypothetical protein